MMGSGGGNANEEWLPQLLTCSSRAAMSGGPTSPCVAMAGRPSSPRAMAVPELAFQVFDEMPVSLLWW
jgi:hypothetical protein